MWLLAQLKYIFNSTFSSLQVRSPKKIQFYIAFSVVFGAIALLISFAICWLFLEMKYPNQSLSNIFFNGDYSLLVNFVATISVVPTLLLTNHYNKQKNDDNGMFSLGRLTKNMSLNTWFFFLIVIALISLLFGYYYFYDIDIYFQENSIEASLDKASLPGEYYKIAWIESLKYYSMSILPIVFIAIGIIHQKTGETSVITLINNAKHVAVFILLDIIVSSSYVSLYSMFDSLIMNIIRIPFEENYITTLFTYLFVILFNAIYYIVISKLAYYCFFNQEKITTRRAEIESDDLLDL